MSKITMDIIKERLRNVNNIDSRTTIDDILRNIDQYTQIDDLLRLVGKGLAESVRQQMITNQILLAIAEGGGIGTIPETSPESMRILERLGAGDDYETIPNVWSGLTVNGNKLLIKGEGSGVISELAILSPTTDTSYTVEVKTDGTIQYKDTYTNFAIVSSYWQDVTAFDDGTYAFTGFNTIYYSNNFEITLIGVSNITFTYIFMKRIQRKQL